MANVIWREFAKEVVEIDSAKIAKETITLAKYVFLDWLGCAIACAQDTASLRQVLNVGGLSGGQPDATLIGSNRCTFLWYAVLSNGIVGSASGLLDTFGPSGMVVSAAVIPTSLSLTEKRGRSGQEFLEAIVVGYEMAAYLDRMRSKVIGARCSNGQIESCAAAAASARILRLNTDATASALAIAWSQAVAPPALNGVLAACAAAEGVIYPLIAQPSTNAVCSSMAELTASWSATWDALGFRHVRLHAADLNTHAAIDAALGLRTAYRLHPEDIEAIDVYVSSQAIADSTSNDLDTVQSLRQSIPYCLALAFLRGRLSPGEFSLQNLLKAPVGWLMANTTVQEDKAFSKDPAYAHGARVLVRTRYGTTYENTIKNPRGSLENPVSTTEIEEKFKQLVSPVLSTEMATTLSDRVLTMDDLTNIDGLFAGLLESIQATIS